MTAAIIAMHGLPLPLVALTLLPLMDEGVFAWQPVVLVPLAGLLLALSLIFHLRQQRAAAGVIRLEATTAEVWLLHRKNGQCDEVELLQQMNLGWCVLLLMKQNRRKFRLVVNASEQPREQLHRLRVLRISQRVGGDKG